MAEVEEEKIAEGVAGGKGLEKLIKGWKTCPLCGREANFVCEKYAVTCKNCGAKWEKMWLTELGLTKPCADGVGKIYVGVAKSPDWWMKSPAERVKEMLKDKGRNIRRAGYAVLGLLALTVAFALVTLLALAAPRVPDIETAKIMALCLVGCGIAMVIAIAYALIEAGELFEFIFARLRKGANPRWPFKDDEEVEFEIDEQGKRVIIKKKAKGKACD